MFRRQASVRIPPRFSALQRDIEGNEIETRDLALTEIIKLLKSPTTDKSTREKAIDLLLKLSSTPNNGIFETYEAVETMIKSTTRLYRENENEVPKAWTILKNMSMQNEKKCRSLWLTPGMPETLTSQMKSSAAGPMEDVIEFVFNLSNVDENLRSMCLFSGFINGILRQLENPNPLTCSRSIQILTQFSQIKSNELYTISGLFDTLIRCLDRNRTADEDSLWKILENLSMEPFTTMWSNDRLQCFLLDHISSPGQLRSSVRMMSLSVDFLDYNPKQGRMSTTDSIDVTPLVMNERLDTLIQSHTTIAKQTQTLKIVSNLCKSSTNEIKRNMCLELVSTLVELLKSPNDPVVFLAGEILEEFSHHDATRQIVMTTPNLINEIFLFVEEHNSCVNGINILANLSLPLGNAQIVYKLPLFLLEMVKRFKSYRVPVLKAILRVATPTEHRESIRANTQVMDILQKERSNEMVAQLAWMYLHEEYHTKQVSMEELQQLSTHTWVCLREKLDIIDDLRGWKFLLLNQKNRDIVWKVSQLLEMFLQCVQYSIDDNNSFALSCTFDCLTHLALDQGLWEAINKESAFKKVIAQVEQLENEDRHWEDAQLSAKGFQGQLELPPQQDHQEQEGTKLIPDNENDIRVWLKKHGDRNGEIATALISKGINAAWALKKLQSMPKSDLREMFGLKVMQAITLEDAILNLFG